MYNTFMYNTNRYDRQAEQEDYTALILTDVLVRSVEKTFSEFEFISDLASRTITKNLVDSITTQDWIQPAETTTEWTGS